MFVIVIFKTDNNSGDTPALCHRKIIWNNLVNLFGYAGGTHLAVTVSLSYFSYNTSVAIEEKHYISFPESAKQEQTKEVGSSQLSFRLNKLISIPCVNS